jgi:hypothetical protein
MFTDSTVDFQTKVLARSGLGDDTYLPPCEHCLPERAQRGAADCGCRSPSQHSLSAAMGGSVRSGLNGPSSLSPRGSQVEYLLPRVS